MSSPLVLVVDDAPEIVFIVQRYGRQAGHAVDGCEDAEAAWRYLQRARPDLLLLDLNLPGTSGLELCRQLKGDSQQAGLRVALFTHWDRPREIASGLEAGADFVISKDLLCRPDDWRARLAEILAARNGHPDLASLSWMQTHPRTSSPEAWLESINQALRHSGVRQLGPEVVAILTERAARQAGLSLERDWLAPDSLALDHAQIACLRPEIVMTFGIALAEQLWRVLGSTGAAG